MKLLVGITGGIGSGKSTVADRLAALGASVVDTDEISRALTGPAGAAMEAVRTAFGARYVTGDGSLDRAAMRALAFEDPAARARLESILHPAIRSAADAALERAPGPYRVIVVPLLFETRGYLGTVSRVLVVDCPEETQAERVRARSGLSADEVRAIMRSQASRAERLAAADDVIDNSGPRDALRKQVAALHQKYLQFAGK